MSWEVRVRMRLGDFELDVDLRGDDTPLALIGPNGSGKTTLLRTIAGAHHTGSGIIRIGDRSLFDSERGIDLPPEQRRVGYVPQGYGLFPHLTVLENVAFGWSGRRPRIPRSERGRAAHELLVSMECAALAERTPPTLSGGEQQRVALARALMIDPQILLLDEPLAALDAPARRTLRSFLADHLDERAGPAIVVTHDVRDVRALGATVAAMDRGRIVQRGTSDTLSQRPINDFVAEFFDAPSAS